MTKKERYIKQIYGIFTEYGVKNFTLDEIASKIGVTKMTLYNNFSGKDQLMNEIVQYRERAFKEYISSSTTGGENAIKILFSVLTFQKNNPHPMSMIFYKSLKQNYPSLYNRYISNFKEQLGSFVKSNIERGIDEGIYQETISAQAISSYVIAAMDNMFAGMVESDREVDLNNMHHDMIGYHLRGIVNSKGIEILEKEIAAIKR